MNNDLICPVCRKHSNNKRAHIRHTSYCRKRIEKPARSRKRSCLACIKAKTHCDVATSPCCTRCKSKGIECKLATGQQERPATTISGSNLTIEANDISSLDLVSYSQANISLTDWSTASISTSSIDELQSDDLAQLLPRRSSPDPLFRVLDPYALGPQLDLQPVKAFTPRAASWGALSLLGRYVAQTIRQYPSMMLSDTTLPPFIHYQCLKNSKPGPLVRCSGIVELWESKSPKNATYLWKILRMEQERLMQDIPGYGDLAAVNALQAVTIYFLLRASSTDDEGTDFDVALIQTMTQLLLRVRDIITAYCDPNSPERPDLCGWVMAESLRRTIATLFIVELLFDISPGMIHGRCNSLALWSAMLLPCSRQLWEAETQAEWTQRYDSLGDERPYYGELLRHDSLDPARSGLLERWMANVDDFGRLVINIASVAEAAC